MGWHLVAFHSLPGGRLQGVREWVTLASLIPRSPPQLFLYRASGIALLSHTDFHDPARGGLLRDRGPVTPVSLTNTAPLRRSGTVMGVKPCRDGRGSTQGGHSGCPAIPQSNPQQRTLRRPEPWDPAIGVHPAFPAVHPRRAAGGATEYSSNMSLPHLKPP